MSAFLAEMWAWYALTVLVVVARLVSRRMLYGSFKRMLADDYLMVFAMLCYTGMLIVVHVLSYTPTNLINPADGIVLTPADIELRAYGSKLVLVVEETQMFTIWAIKGCFVFMYTRLTISLKQGWMVKALAGYCIVSFIAMQVLFFGAWCRPFHHYWQVPPDDLNCSAETNHMITNAVFNISTDIMIIVLPMPLFLQSQLALKRKLVLCGVFALGAFTILAAAMSKYYSLSQPYGGDWIYWYIREVSTAIITANLPMTWTLLQRCFRIGSFNGIYGKSSGHHTGAGGGTGAHIGGGTNRFRSAYGNLSSHHRSGAGAGGPGGKKGSTVHDLDDISPSESQEGITGTNNIPLHIYQKKDIVVVSEEITPPRQAARGPNVVVSGKSSADTLVQGGTAGIVRTSSERKTAAGGATFGVPYYSGRDSPDGSIGEHHKASGGAEMGVVTKAYHGV